MLFEVLELSPCHQRGLCGVTRIGSKLVLAFSHDQLVNEINVTEEKDRYVVLCWDEIKVKEGLAFDSIVVNYV